MDKPIPKVRSKKVGNYRLQLTTYQSVTRGGMLELVDPYDDGVLFEAHYMHRDNAVEQYRASYW